MSWEGWNPQDTSTERDDGVRLHDAYESMKEMTVLAWREADAKTAMFKRWFAESDADNVKNVLGRIMDRTLSVPEAQPRLTSRVLDRTDFGNGCRIMGMNAYTARTIERHHVCPHGLEKPDLTTMVCDDLDNSTGGPGSRYPQTRSGALRA
jgi:hypothetical protein